MKIPLQYVDEFDSIISEDGYDSMLKLKQKIAKELGISVVRVTVSNHSGVGEWVIYVDGVFYDYVGEVLNYE